MRVVSGSKCRLHKSDSPFFFLPYFDSSVFVLLISCSIAYILSGYPLILTDYVKKQGWHLAKTYVDDGYSGTNFTIRFLFLFAFLSSPILKSSFPDRAGERLKTSQPCQSDTINPQKEKAYCGKTASADDCQP